MNVDKSNETPKEKKLFKPFDVTVPGIRLTRDALKKPFLPKRLRR